MALKAGPSGPYDDDRFGDSELVYRRVPKRPDFLATIDPITEQERPTPAAFSIKDGEDGLSVYADSLIEAHGLERQRLCAWDTHGVAEFEVGLVRAELGIVGKVDSEDTVMGLAHAVVRGPGGTPSKSVWKAKRVLILRQLRFYPVAPRNEIAE